MIDLETLALTKGKPIFLRINGAVDYRLNELCKNGRDRNTIAEAGLIAEITRLETEAAPVSAAESEAITMARKAGLDPVATLIAATEARIAGAPQT